MLGRETVLDIGWSEELTGTVLLPDGYGDVLSIRCFGRLPEQGKRSLRRLPTAEVMLLLKRWPDLRLTAALAKCIDRFNANRAQTRHGKYPEWGMQIGPGVGEGACRWMIRLRLKWFGSHWNIGDASAVLSVKCSCRNRCRVDVLHWKARQAMAV